MKEIERKWLFSMSYDAYNAKPFSYKKEYKVTKKATGWIDQSYLYSSPETDIRCRAEYDFYNSKLERIPKRYTICIKQKDLSNQLVRLENEYEISEQEFKAMSSQGLGKKICKHVLIYDVAFQVNGETHHAEVRFDFFHLNLWGLSLIEAEFDTEAGAENFDISCILNPEDFSALSEVTDNPLFRNSSLKDYETRTDWHNEYVLIRSND